MSDVDRLDRLEQRLDGLHDYVEGVEAHLEDLQAEHDALREELATLQRERDAAVEQLEERLARVEQRTDYLRLIEDLEAADGETRSKVLLQNLKREATDRRRAGKDPIAGLDRDAAERVLGYPDVDRTTIYSDMQRVARWVDDPEVCWYDAGTLRLDLRAGDLPTHAVEAVEPPQQGEAVSGSRGTAPATGGGE